MGSGADGDAPGDGGLWALLPAAVFHCPVTSVAVPAGTKEG